MEIKGNVIEKLFIKLYRLVRRLVFCRIELEKQKIKLEEEGYKLKQEENQENKNKIEKEAEKIKLANEGERLEKEKEQIAEKSTALEQEKGELEKKLEPKKNKFIGLVEYIKDRKNREITQEESRRVINEHKQTLTKDISNKKKELEKNKENAHKLLCDFLRDVSKELIERDKISREKVAEITARAEVTVQEGSAIERAVKKALEEIKQKAVEKQGQQIHTQGDNLNRIFEEIDEILINSITKDISESLQEVTTKMKGEEWVVIHDLDRDEREGGLSDRMSNFQDKAEELIKQRVNLAEKKAELEKNKEYAEGFLTPLLISQPGTTKPTLKECKKYCNDIVNKELLQKSVENNYSPEQITWITEVFKDFNKLFKTEDYKDNLQYADQHIEDCKKSQVFLELLSNTFVPLMNTGNLLIALNACYPEGGNQERENKIRSCYNKLTNNKVNEVNKHDIECVMSYIEKIQDHLKAPGENGSLHHESALKNAKLEIERLENKETLKIKSEIHDCVLTKIKKGFSQFIDDVQREDMTQQENIASAARKVGTDFKNIKSLNLGEIISPNTRFLNPLAKLQENRYVDGPNRG